MTRVILLPTVLTLAASFINVREGVKLDSRYLTKTALLFIVGVAILYVLEVM